MCPYFNFKWVTPYLLKGLYFIFIFLFKIFSILYMSALLKGEISKKLKEISKKLSYFPLQANLWITYQVNSSEILIKTTF